MTTSFASRFHGTTTAWVVLAASLTLTGAAWVISNGYVERETSRRFDARVGQVVEAVSDRMLAYEQVLRGGAGLYAASREVSRDEWRAYVNKLEIDRYYPGIQGMGVSVPVRAEDKDAHVASVRAEGFPEYTIRPETPRETYHSIVFLEPFDWRNQRAFGFDMYSNPIRRRAMQAAIDSGASRISSKVTLVQETDEDVQQGFLFYTPVYRNRAEAWTLPLRRESFECFVYAAFRADDLMRGILGNQVNDVRLQIYDGGVVSAEHLLFESKSEQGADPFVAGSLSSTRSLDVNGSTWTLEVDASEHFLSTGESVQSLAVAVGGLTVDILLFLIIVSLSSGRRTASREALERTDDLRASQRQFHAFAHTSQDGILACNGDGLVVQSNPAAEHIFGCDPGELAGAFVQDLLDDQGRFEVAEVLGRLCQRRQRADEVAPFEAAALRADGSRTDVEVSSGQWEEAGRVYTSLSVRDISQRVRSDRKSRRRAVDLRRSNDKLRNFARFTSRDLSWPLMSLKELVGWIANDTANALPPTSRYHLELMEQRVDTMRNLLDDLLEAAVGEQPVGASSEVALMDLTARVAARCTPAAQIDVVYTGLISTIETDADTLERVLEHLVDNAAKHHDGTSGRVEFSCEKRAGGWEFLLSDDGPGVQPDDRERVFAAFESAQERGERRGAGMGLSIVRRLIERRGGHVEIEPSTDRGTTVKWTWPASQDSAEITPPSDDDGLLADALSASQFS